MKLSTNFPPVNQATNNQLNNKIMNSQKLPSENQTINSDNTQAMKLPLENHTIEVLKKQKELIGKALKEAQQKEKETRTKSEFMKIQIMERTDKGYLFKEEKRKFGLVKHNRPINISNVDDFKQIINNREYDESRSIIVIEAIDIINKYDIVDLEGNPIQEQDAKDFLIVLDGQHRVTAFAKINAIKKDYEKISIPNVHIKKNIENIGKYLVETNRAGRDWNASDKLCVASLTTQNDILIKINELIKTGFKATTACLIYAGKRITPVQMNKILKDGDVDSLPTDAESTIKRADRFIETCLQIDKMTRKMLSKRYFIEGFQTLLDKVIDEDKAFTVLASLTFDDFKNTKSNLDFYNKLFEKSGLKVVEAE